MTARTGRYTGNFETQVEQDLRRLSEVDDAKGFLDTIDHLIDTELTDDYWDVRLPAQLETSASFSPTLFAYHASLVLLEARPLSSKLSIGELLDPATHAPRSAIERHHLFPKAYLADIGIDSMTMRNQIANYAFVEWPDNAAIGKAPPEEYFPELFDALSPKEREQAKFWHALPDGWERMDYREFLEERRRLIAKVVQAAFEKLRSGEVPQVESLPEKAEPPRLSFEEILMGEEVEDVEFKSSAFFSYKPDVPERVVKDSIVKTVAGFLNAGGGTLLIGVADDKEVLGIGADLEHKGLDADGYVNALTSLLMTSLDPAAATLVKIRVEEVEGEQICVVDVPPASDEVYAKVAKGDQVFFVRSTSRHGYSRVGSSRSTAVSASAELSWRKRVR